MRHPAYGRSRGPAGRESSVPTTLLDAAETAAVRHVVEGCASRPANTDTVFDLLDELQALIDPLLARVVAPPRRQVARALGIAPATVRKHLEHAHERLGVQSRTEALRAAVLDDHPSWTTPTDRGHGT
jgi:FixJ family two-component response regulator